MVLYLIKIIIKFLSIPLVPPTPFVVGATNIKKQYEHKVCTGITFLLYDQQLQQTLAFHLKA
jgi:hypothetical protein